LKPQLFKKQRKISEKALRHKLKKHQTFADCKSVNKPDKKSSVLAINPEEKHHSSSKALGYIFKSNHSSKLCS
jgi:hypothetical protein